MDSNVNLLTCIVSRFCSLDKQVFRKFKSPLFFLLTHLIVNVLNAAVLPHYPWHILRREVKAFKQTKKLIRLSILHLNVKSSFGADLGLIEQLLCILADLFER